MKTKLTSFLLVLLALCMLAGCNGKKDPTTPSETSAPVGETPTEAPANENEYDPALDSLDFEDIKVTFAVPIMSDVSAFEFHSDGMSDHPVNNAIFKRNNTVQEKLGVKLEFVSMDSMQMIDKIPELWFSSDETNDIYAVYAYFTMDCMIQGCYENLIDSPYLHTDSPWWNQSYVEEITYNDSLYTIVGDACTSIVSKITATFVNNKLMLANGKTDDLYEVVESGNWTIPYMMELCKDVYQSLDGGPDPTNSDTYGLIIGRISQPAEGLLEAGGFKWTTKDEAGTIVMNLTDSNNITLLGKLEELFTTAEKGIRIIAADELEGVYEYADYFARGQAMVTMGPMYTAETVKSADADFDYQILPLPKADSTQTEYRNSCQDSYSALSISSVSDAKEAASAVLEYMGYLSRRDLTPAYVDTYYKGQVASDPKTMKLFDEIKESVVFSFARVYSRNIKDVTKKMRSLVGNSEEIGSGTKSHQTLCQEYLEDLLMKLDGMRG